MSDADHADMLLLGGKVVTVDSVGTIAESLGVKDGRIIYVGDSNNVKRLIGEGTEVIDLNGRTVLPGFIDAHTHVEGIADYHLMLDVHVPPLKGVQQILEKVKNKVQETPVGHWIVGAGGWGQPLPTKEDLDVVAPEHPVILRESAHDQVLNSKALEMANITKDTPDPPGGKIWKDPKTGKPTGQISEMFQTLPIPPHSHEERKNAIKHVLHEEFIQQGVTSVYTFPDFDSMRTYQELLSSNELPVRLRLFLFVNAGFKMIDLECLLKLGLETGFGNDWLRIGGVKMMVDGESKTAGRYDPPDQRKKWTGIFKITQEDLNNAVFEAHKAGLQIWAHAIGDKAQDMILDAYELALQKMPKNDHRHRIEHAANNEAGPTTPEQLDKMKRLGIIPVPTAAWIYLGMVYFPSERRFIYRTLFDRGFLPPGNSDSLGSMPESINPFFSIWCAVARKTRDGGLNCPEESITVMEAIRMYTMNSAYSGFEEKVKGSIEKGKYADLIILSDDPLTVPVDKIKDIRVETTIIDGKIVYQSKRT